jgi:hypothetical protein
MTDALRSDRSASSRDAPDRERDARVERLLLSGLDHYFAGRYELAISVWTRVLFLDRGHARARAYIERARSAVAERQREGDELFHAGATALGRGDHAAARALLTSALQRGTSGEDALALLHRLDRMEAAASVPSLRPGGGVRLPDDGAAAPDRRPHRDTRLIWLAGGLLGGVLLAIVAAGYLWIVAEPFDVGAGRGPAPHAAADPLPVLTPGELRLRRAQGLVAAGRLRDALAMLESAPVDERDRASVDALRRGIQRRLLDSARNPSASPPPVAGSDR